MKTTARIFAAAAVIGGILASCSDLSDLEQRVESLESRVTALEKVIPSLNENIEALQTLMSAGTISSASQKDGVWTITLSNGENISLTQGSVGVGNAPVMSVDKDGYWMVDYGKGAEYINGENKVKALGTDGITPVFGVDAEGFWTVSYDNGKTFQQVAGADGKPVSALPSGEVQDPYFEDVKIVDGILTVTLRGGETVTVPVVADFLCAIEADGVQAFTSGEKKPFNVTMKGVKSTMITVPAGWSATLSEADGEEAVLTVTAPVLSKAVIADSNSDISILAFSTQGYAAIAKLEVLLTDAPIIVTPVANVSAGEATETSLTFNVATANTTSWKYILVKSSETAPEAEKIAAEGTEGTGTSLTVEGLESSTSYALYVLPINGEDMGAVASASNTTKKAPIASYYALYNAGETITIEGRSFSKEVNGEATLMEADGEIKTNGVYFIKEGVTASYTGTGAIKNLLVVGDKDGVRSTFMAPVDAYMNLNGGNDGTGFVVFHNVIFDHSAKSNQYAITVNFNETFPLMMFSNCEIKQNADKTLFYIANDARSFADLRFVNCDCKITSTQAILATSSKVPVYGTYTVDNCIFYGDGTKAFSLHNGNKATFNSIVFTNNTFVNVLAGNNVWFNCGTVNTTTITGNIMYMSSDKAMASNNSIVNSANALITGGTVSDNICYTGQEKTFMAIYGGKEKWFEGVKEITKLSDNPFEGGTFDPDKGNFVPAAAYATYGAKR